MNPNGKKVEKTSKQKNKILDSRWVLKLVGSVQTLSLRIWNCFYLKYYVSCQKRRLKFVFFPIFSKSPNFIREIWQFSSQKIRFLFLGQIGARSVFFYHFVCMSVKRICLSWGGQPWTTWYFEFLSLIKKSAFCLISTNFNGHLWLKNAS